VAEEKNGKGRSVESNGLFLLSGEKIEGKVNKLVLNIF
jgi:hypothetical protein